MVNSINGTVLTYRSHDCLKSVFNDCLDTRLRAFQFVDLQIFLRYLYLFSQIVSDACTQ
jgi:hypothetical protein